MFIINDMKKSEIIEQVIEHYQGPSALARRFGLKPQNITLWRERGIPLKYCPIIETDTSGKFTCHAMRPDWYPAPETDGAAA